MAGHWTPGRICRRSLQVLREQGTASLAFKVLGETFYRHAFLVERPTRREAGKSGDDGGTTVGELDPQEAGGFHRFNPALDPTAVRRRLEAGHRCFVVRRGGEIVHAQWAAFGEAWVDYLSRQLPLAPDEAFISEARTDPAARRQGLARLTTLHMSAVLDRAGVRRMLAIVVPENPDGMAFASAAGYRPIALLGSIRLGRWRRDLSWHGREAASWDRCLSGVWQRHYLDGFLGDLKRRAHLSLYRRWRPQGGCARLLKTDLFEESAGPDAILGDIAPDAALPVGMDISLAVVRRAAERLGPAGSSVVRADVRQLPFRNGAFGMVISPSTLDHFSAPDDLGRSLRELARVLEPGGRLVVTLDNRQNLFDPLLRLASRLGCVPYPLGRSCTVGELRAELHRAGLEVRETTAILHNPRLLAVGSIRLAGLTGSRRLTRLVQGLLLRSQSLERTRWRYLTGSFVAALAVRPASDPEP